MICTRFAPSPTGFLHIGGVRTALFAWAFARRHGGNFILRIEDTDSERSTTEATKAILDGMAWLGLNADEGPYFQSERNVRYQEAIRQMLQAGSAYPCYMSSEELAQLREQQSQRGEKPRYNGLWRPESGKDLPQPPGSIKPVIRFKNPGDGHCGWLDAVKGNISIANSELDDFIIARADGTPTYNFCVVVDDLDMKVSHVIRGDDHVNNTPRQINLFRALGAQPPVYAHVSMILGEDGQKLSKRHGAVSVMQYEADGFLPEAVVNYLARLGWSHGNDEIFSRQQLTDWFDLEHINSSAAQFDREKLLWINQQYMKTMSPDELAEALRPFMLARLEQEGEMSALNVPQAPDLAAVVDLYQDRCSTLVELAEATVFFYHPPIQDNALLTQHLTRDAQPALVAFAADLQGVDWQKQPITTLLKTKLTEYGLKMPQLAMPLRVILTGRAYSPSVDSLLYLLGRERVLGRLKNALQSMA